MKDYLSDTHVAAPHTGHVSPKGNVTPDAEEDALKPMWRPCPKCHALPEDGQFRLINIRWGLMPCKVCLVEEREAVERMRYTLTNGSLDKQADRFLKLNGCKLQWKRGGKQLK